MKFEIVNDHIIWEKIGKQITIADLMTGKYCCIAVESGVIIWLLALNHYSKLEIKSILRDHYCLDQEFSSMIVEKFLDGLMNIHLLKESNSDQIPQVDCKSLTSDLKSNFEEPKISIYDEIGGILQLDPIDDELEKSLIKSNS